MSKIYVPITSAEEWKKLLAEPEKQWRMGYSARTLAASWLAADGFPPGISALFESSGLPAFQSVMPFIIIPEHKVLLPPRSGHPSQNDLFVLAKASDGSLISMTVEGKVLESFGRRIGEWMKYVTSGKRTRLTFLLKKLGLPEKIPDQIRYQLLHRLASAVIEAERFGARQAIMVIHSFSQTDKWFSDFEAFVSLYEANVKVGELTHLKKINGISMYAGWVRGDHQYLSM
jgi:hypothetical protein